MNSVPESAWTVPAWTGTAAALPAVATDPDPVAALPSDSLLHLAFLDRAAETPDAVAVVAADRTLTYAELANESARLAGLLAARGLGCEALVAVVMEKGWEQVVACLGVLRAGAAYVPVDPQWPARRLADVLGAADITEALTQPNLVETVAWPEGVAATAVAAPAADLSAGPAPAAPAVDIAPGDLAYVIYTSGSTGMPKGVMIEHGPAYNTVRDVNRELGCAPEDRVLALSALNFDLSVYDLFGPLSAGGAVVLPAPGDAREPGAWLRLATAAGVTLWNSVPALMAMFTEYVRTAPPAPLPPLRAVLMSGDWIPVGLPGEIRELFPEARQWSLGGATEASIWSIWHPITPADAELASIPYGRSMSGQHVYVGDGMMRPRSCWVPGEILIAGVGLARGYLGDAERTARSFVTDPATSARRYRTGDWGRLLPSGEIEFLGREDMQVKVGGHRIELGDVEAALLACPGVRGAVADVRGGRHRTRLTAQVLLEPGAGHSAEDVRALLAERVPSYLVPTAVTVRDEFPLTPNGKVDRKALAALAALAARTDEAAAEHVVEHPADADEELLLGIWRGFFTDPAPRPGQDVAGGATGGTADGAGDVATDRPADGVADGAGHRPPPSSCGTHLSVTDNFFELGGDSLRAVRLMSVLRRETGVELPVSALFGAPTVRTLARRLREARETATRDGFDRPVVVPVRTTGDAVPLVFAHPVGGDVLCYSELARELGADQPFYALQSPDHDGRAPGFAELVTHYAQAVLDEVPGRRYRLGGWSMGAVLALELARELTARGCVVDLVAAVDVLETPQDLARAEISRDRLLGWLARDLAGLTGGVRPVPPGPFETLEELYEAVRGAGILPADIAPAEFASLYGRFEANAQALCGYRPGGPLTGTAVHFLQAEAGGGPAAAEGWRPLCAGGFTLTEVPGDHYTVLKGPGARTVATHLRALLTTPTPA